MPADAPGQQRRVLSLQGLAKYLKSESDKSQQLLAESEALLDYSKELIDRSKESIRRSCQVLRKDRNSILNDLQGGFPTTLPGKKSR